MRNNWRALEFASADLRNDLDCVLPAVHQVRCPPASFRAAFIVFDIKGDISRITTLRPMPDSQSD